MSKRSLVVVLPEDKRHQQFVRRFLYRMGFSKHEIVMEAISGGRGSGEQWVRRSYPTQVRAYRRRSARAQTALMVVIDADTHGVERRLRQLRDALAHEGLAERSEDEAIVHLIPKRNIETWILCLSGRAVDEDTDYRREPGVDELIANAAVAFFDSSRVNAAVPAYFVESLRSAIPEVRRLD